MPTRTEKKFGQANQVGWGSATELVATAANRRNVVVNISARSSAEVGLATFTSAPVILASTSYAAIEAPVGGTATLANAFAIAVTKNKKKFAALGATTSIVGSIDVSTATAFTKTHATSTVALAELDQNAIDLNTGSYNNQDAWTNMAVWIDDNTILAYSPETCSATTTEDRVAVLGVDGAGAITKALNYNLPPDQVSDTNFQYRGVYALQHGYGLAAGGMAANTAVTSGAVGFGIRTFGGYGASYINPTQISTLWWDLDGVAGKTSGLLYNFFSSIEYNPKYDIFAISSPATTSNPWLGAAPTSGTGSFASNRPSLPSTVAPAGFRIVAGDGTSGADRKFLDGTTTFPAAPAGGSGLTVSAETTSYPTVVSLKFSPDGEKLAAMYNSGTIGIYVRQSGGTWLHSHTVNTTAGGGPVASGGPDQMAWCADNTTVFVVSNGQSVTETVYGFQFGAGDIPIGGAANFENKFTVSAGFPNLIGSQGAISSEAKTASATPYNWTHSGTAVGCALSGSIIDETGRNVLIAVSSEDTNLGTGVLGMAFFKANVNVSVGTSGTQPGYINSVMSATKISSGETIQISNIVLEPNEMLYISSGRDGGIDAAAYGVEIS